MVRGKKPKYSTPHKAQNCVRQLESGREREFDMERDNSVYGKGAREQVVHYRSSDVRDVFLFVVLCALS
jgi:hypothetical protein